MKQIFGGAAVTVLLLCTSAAQAFGSQPPPQGYIPDSKTAVRIAVAVLSAIYGEGQIQSEKPFRASLSHGVWTVNGSLPKPIRLGGTAFIQISKKDGRILFVMHTK